MEEAQSVNLDIAAAKARLLRGRAPRARVAGAPLLPSITGDFDACARARRGPPASRQSGVGGRTSTTYRAFLSASYEIDFWGKNRDAALSAEQSAVATPYDADVISLATLASVANAYFQVLRRAGQAAHRARTTSASRSACSMRSASAWLPAPRPISKSRSRKAC